MKIRLSPLARRDWSDISCYTAKYYGEQQVVRYLSKLEAQLSTLSTNPELGHHRDELPKRYLCLSVQKHVVIYEVTEKEIIIFRILHGSVNLSSHKLH